MHSLLVLRTGNCKKSIESGTGHFLDQILLTKPGVGVMYMSIDQQCLGAVYTAALGQSSKLDASFGKAGDILISIQTPGDDTNRGDACDVRSKLAHTGHGNMAELDVYKSGSSTRNLLHMMVPWPGLLAMPPNERRKALAYYLRVQGTRIHDESSYTFFWPEVCAKANSSAPIRAVGLRIMKDSGGGCILKRSSL